MKKILSTIFISLIVSQAFCLKYVYIEKDLTAKYIANQLGINVRKVEINQDRDGKFIVIVDDSITLTTEQETLLNNLVPNGYIFKEKK